MSTSDPTHDKSATELAIHNEIQPVQDTPPSKEYVPDEYREIDNGDVAIDALGGTIHDLPKGYYLSKNFIGTLLGLCLGQTSCYFGFIMPANVLTIINDDLGPDPNYVWVSMIVSIRCKPSISIWCPTALTKCSGT